MMSPYENDNTRWEAYQFSDPFANCSFICLNLSTRVACRPNCDFHPKCESKQDVQFFDSIHSIKTSIYKFCSHCNPSSPKTALNLELIKMTIHSINHSIGFTEDLNDLKRRAYSVSALSTNDPHFKGERQLSRNESEHFKLVELACRHIAAAAIDNLMKQQSRINSSEDVTKKKKRGGVLGFKELAVKSKLSAWHFHRVFKSVTGLTPKSYGDRCWEFVKSRDRPLTLRQQQRANNGNNLFKSISSDLYSTSAKTPHNLRRKSEFLSPLDVESDSGCNSAIKTRKKRKVSADESAVGKRSSLSSSLSTNTIASSTKSSTSGSGLSSGLTSGLSSCSGSVSSTVSSCMSGGSLASNTTTTTPSSSISSSSIAVPIIEQLQLNSDLLRSVGKQDINKNSLDINDVPAGDQSVDFGSVNNVGFNELSKIMSPAPAGYLSFDNNLSMSTMQSQQDQTYIQYAQSQLQPSHSQPVSNLSTKANCQQPTPQAVLSNQQCLNQQPVMANGAPQPLATSPPMATVPLASSKIDESQWPTLQAFTPFDQIFDQEKNKQTPISVMSEHEYLDNSHCEVYDFMTGTSEFLGGNAYLLDYQKGTHSVADLSSGFCDLAGSINFYLSDNNGVVDQGLLLGPDTDSDTYSTNLPITHC